MTRLHDLELLIRMADGLTVNIATSRIAARARWRSGMNAPIQRGRIRRSPRMSSVVAHPMIPGQGTAKSLPVSMEAGRGLLAMLAWPCATVSR